MTENSLYGLDVDQFRLYVVRVALERLSLHSPAAENLVLGTCLHESHLRWIDQIDKDSKPGPAFGPGQMERPTHDDIWRSFLLYQPGLRATVVRCAPFFTGEFPDATALRTDLLYACVMCRIHYRRVKEALPSAANAVGLTNYWKQHYNTPLGRGTVEQAFPHFQRATQL